MLRDQIRGGNQSWAIRWYAYAFLQDKLVLYPGRSVTSNIGFDRSGVLQDFNVAFPVDRARDLVAAGELGSVATNNYSFLGAQRTYDGILQDSGPAVARQLRADGVDVVFLTGT